MINGIRLGSIAVGCDNPIKLRDFYVELLGWGSLVMFNSSAARSETGLVLLFMEADVSYAKPTWPEETGKQQKQVHFDFQVDNVPLAVQQAEALGAQKAESQFGKSHYVTMLDPEGHPFCLCAK